MNSQKQLLPPNHTGMCRTRWYPMHASRQVPKYLFKPFWFKKPIHLYVHTLKLCVLNS